MKKVFVGMSGGVDSSVSAGILKEQGYDVTGVFIKVWQPDFVECTWKEDRLDAMRVASLLDIPFVTLDLEKEYKEGVIDYMIDEYKNGRTPNPDVMCNKEVKFGAFLRWAQDQGADFVATGHYAQTDGKSLLVSKDKNKDQTYFLWALTQEQLKKILFPVGNMTKDEVRKRAEKYNLPVATKKDSQGLCFVGTIDVKTLLKEYIDEKQGDVQDEKGEIIGHHEGVMFYTIGERHGFVITKNKVEEKPYFIVGKNYEKNVLVVSHDPPHEKSGNGVLLEKTNWIKKIQKGEVYEARTRYRAPLGSIKIIDENRVELLDETLVITEGQSLVVYENDKCVGGGIMQGTQVQHT